MMYLDKLSYTCVILLMPGGTRKSIPSQPGTGWRGALRGGLMGGTATGQAKI